MFPPGYPTDNANVAAQLLKLTIPEPFGQTVVINGEVVRWVKCSQFAGPNTSMKFNMSSPIFAGD
ncbi:hypothetical protein CW304_13535 [Bacillus sp. UFRGS-B20]|nr:hypothetical protein CW304_13535 [Bacillus sp. UFRGS-B20]